MQTPIVSILICTYNAENTIVDTINSCLNQTYQNTQVLIHDDQSKDTTISLIKSLNNSKITIIDSWKKLWPYWWLNFLLDHAEWEYIAIQDHDDLWMSTKIEKQIQFLESTSWKDFVWCGTRTRMCYEWDDTYFDYYLGEENYYTLHPSLVFRNQWHRYPEDRVYMNDAYFQKIILCQWEKKIYNIDETLTIHRIKSWAENYSYQRFTYNLSTFKNIFTLHPIRYWICIIVWETMRKIMYPLFHKIGKWTWIDQAERIPFQLQWYKIEKYNNKKLKNLGLQ